MTHAQILTSRLLAVIASAGLVALGCGGGVGGEGSKTGPESTNGGQDGQGGAVSETGGRGGTGSMIQPNVTCDFGTPEQVCYGRAQLENMVRVGGGQIPVSPTPTEAEVAAAFLPNGCLPASKTFDGCCNPAEAEAQKNGEECCYVHCTGVCCGRPLFVEGVARVAPFVARTDWATPNGTYPDVATPVSLEVAGAIARSWRDDALFEHASVASFARFSLDLLALGAPADLVLASHRAALDEIEHARLCFALAERFGGAPVGPGPLDLSGVVPAASLADAVVSAVREGCVGETVAALVAREELARALDPAVRAALSRIAEDEARHAELAFRFVAWALGQDRELEETVRHAFDAEIERNVLVGPTVSAAHQAAWSAAGRLTGAELTRIEAQAKSEVVRAAMEALLPPKSHVRAEETARA